MSMSEEELEYQKIKKVARDTILSYDDPKETIEAMIDCAEPLIEELEKRQGEGEEQVPMTDVIELVRVFCEHLELLKDKL